MAEIKGFSGGILPSVKEKWPYEHNGETFTFGKNREGANHFAYYVQRNTSSGGFTGDVSTGFETDRDMTRAEVEQWPRFVNFMDGDG